MKWNKIHTLLFFSFLCVLLSGCQTYKESMSYASYDPIESKLPAMAVTWKSPKENPMGYDYSRMKQAFLNEVKANCVEEPTDSIYGTVEAELEYYNEDANMGFPMLSGLTFFSLNLLGMPILAGELEAHLCVRIYDSNNHVVKKYRYSKSMSTAMGLYYGKSPNVLSNNIGKALAEEIKNDLRCDATGLLPSLATKAFYPLGTQAGKHIQKAMEFSERGKYQEALSELEKADRSKDLCPETEKLMDGLYQAIFKAQQIEKQEKAEMWTAIGAAVAATAATATAIAASTGGSSSKSSKATAPTAAKNISTNATSSSASSKSNDDDWDDSIDNVKINCLECHGSGKCRFFGVGSRTIHCGGSGECPECHGKKVFECDVCDGTGLDKHEGKCRRCNGKKHYDCSVCNGTGNCTNCNGTGKCQRCNGTGKE